MDNNDFIIDRNPHVWWPVVVSRPVDGGKFADFVFEADIRVLSPEEFAALTAEPTATETPETLPKPGLAEVLKGNAAKLPPLVRGWRGVKTPDGAAVPYAPAVLAEQLCGPRGAALSTGLWNALNEVRFGVRLGNFAPPPSAGSA